MNYAEIQVNGEKVGLYFGLTALKEIASKIDNFFSLKRVDSESYEASIQIGNVCTILYAGYLNNCDIELEKPTIKRRVFYEYIENAAVTEKEIPADILEAIKIFTNSKVLNSFSKNGVLTEEEKKN